MNQRIKPRSRKQLVPHISPLGLLQEMGWFQDGTLWKLEFYSVSKGRNRKTWKMFFKSVSCDKNWEFGSKAIDFLEKLAAILVSVSWNHSEGAGFGQCRWGCCICPWSALPRVAFFSWLLPAWLSWWVILTQASVRYFHLLQVLFSLFIKIREVEELSKSYHVRTTFPQATKLFGKENEIRPGYRWCIEMQISVDSNMQGWNNNFTSAGSKKRKLKTK